MIDALGALLLIVASSVYIHQNYSCQISKSEVVWYVS